jgi:tripartite-type tricarboxylate transporter receptor subunit TctC
MATIFSACNTSASNSTSSAAPASGSNKSGTSVDLSAIPNKPVSVIVPYSAGGGTDITVRALIDTAKSNFSKNITVDNRTGGGGAVGLSYGAHSKADGTSITAVTVELTTLHNMGTSDITYDQFKPLLMYNSAPSCITVKADSKYNTLQDLIADSKNNDIQIGNSGVGAIWHLAAAGLAKAADTKFTYVPFDGANPAITSLLGGHIQAVSVSYPEVSSHVKAGDLKVLAVLSDKRLDSLPDVKTAKEQGYDVSIGTWRGLAVPKDTPDNVVAALSAVFTQAGQSDAFKTFMSKNNEAVTVMSPSEFSEKIKADDTQFKSLIGDLGLAKK